MRSGMTTSLIRYDYVLLDELEAYMRVSKPRFGRPWGGSSTRISTALRSNAEGTDLAPTALGVFALAVNVLGMGSSLRRMRFRAIGIYRPRCQNNRELLLPILMR